MTTQFSVADIQLELLRYPPKAETNLQAWDAADKHLLKLLKETEQKVKKEEQWQERVQEEEEEEKGK